jgi:pimeloyl-ACP methyl ester carboxylesterase
MTNRSESLSASSVKKPAIVFAPGFMTDHDMWSDVAPYFEGHEIIFADFREGTTLQELAASNLKRCPDRFILIGFSLGGYIARHMLYQAPERVEALILVGTSTRPSAPATNSGNGAKMFRGMSRNALVRAVHINRGQDEVMIKRLMDMGERLGAEVFARLSALDRQSDLEAMRSIRCPVLVVTADQDRLRTMEESREMAQATGAELVVIENSGHMMPMEEPRQFAQVVLSWLMKVAVLQRSERD